VFSIPTRYNEMPGNRKIDGDSVLLPVINLPIESPIFPLLPQFKKFHAQYKWSLEIQNGLKQRSLKRPDLRDKEYKPHVDGNVNKRKMNSLEVDVTALDARELAEKELEKDTNPDIRHETSESVNNEQAQDTDMFDDGDDDDQVDGTADFDVDMHDIFDDVPNEFDGPNDFDVERTECCEDEELVNETTVSISDNDLSGSDQQPEMYQVKDVAREVEHDIEANQMIGIAQTETVDMEVEVAPLHNVSLSTDGTVLLTFYKELTDYVVRVDRKMVPLSEHFDIRFLL